jgi:hypothetical protein
MPTPNTIRKALAARAAADCPECHGAGFVTFTARNIHGEVEEPCACVDLEDWAEGEDWDAEVVQ